MAAAARLYAGEARIQVPQLLPWCTAQMTAMERVRGTHVADARLPPGLCERLAESMVTGLLARPFWSRGEEVLIHADPHAGNLVATHDGRLAVLDWSLAARLSKAHREALVDAAAGGFTVRCAADRSGGGCSRLADTRGSATAGGGGAGAAAGAAADLARV